MKLTISSILLMMIMVPAVPEASDLSDLRKELRLAQSQAMDASIRSDSLGLSLARNRFERLLREEAIQRDAELAAIVHYYLGFVDFQFFWSIPEVTGNGVQRLNQVLKQMDKALARHANLVDAHVMSAMCHYFLSFMDRPNVEQHNNHVTAAVQKAESLAPNNPHLAFFRSFQSSYLGRRDDSIRFAENAIDQFEDSSRPSMKLADWWQVWPYAFLAGYHINTGKRDEAERLIEKALILRPDFEYVVVNRLPAIALQPVINPRRFNAVDWTELARDPQGDGSNGDLADASALHSYYDRESDSLWFRIDMHKMPDSNAFGLNLVVDVDGNLENGGSWWGGNNSFRYDKLVTVWVTGTLKDGYSGFVGICSSADARKTWFLRLGQNNVAFGIDPGRKTLMFAFKRTDLDESRNLNIVASAGSNVGWNDDIPNEGSIKLVIP